jgi:hypothetical protein
MRPAVAAPWFIFDDIGRPSTATSAFGVEMSLLTVHAFGVTDVDIEQGKKKKKKKKAAPTVMDCFSRTAGPCTDAAGHDYFFDQVCCPDSHGRLRCAPAACDDFGDLPESRGIL